MVDCESRLQVLPGRQWRKPSGPDFITVGPVVFTAWFRDEPRRQLDVRRGRWKRLKAPIFVEAGPATTVTILGRDARRTRLDVGLDRGGSANTSAIRFVPCPPDATVGSRRVGSPTPFIGGWRIRDPDCVRVAVLPDGATDPIRKRLPFGEGTCQRQD